MHKNIWDGWNLGVYIWGYFYAFLCFYNRIGFIWGGRSRKSKSKYARGHHIIIKIASSIGEYFLFLHPGPFVADHLISSNLLILGGQAAVASSVFYNTLVILKSYRESSLLWNAPAYYMNFIYFACDFFML